MDIPSNHDYDFRSCERATTTKLTNFLKTTEYLAILLQVVFKGTVYLRYIFYAKHYVH